MAQFVSVFVSLQCPQTCRQLKCEIKLPVDVSVTVSPDVILSWVAVTSLSGSFHDKKIVNEKILMSIQTASSGQQSSICLYRLQLYTVVKLIHNTIYELLSDGMQMK